MYNPRRFGFGAGSGRAGGGGGASLYSGAGLLAAIGGGTEGAIGGGMGGGRRGGAAARGAATGVMVRAAAPRADAAISGNALTSAVRNAVADWNRAAGSFAIAVRMISLNSGGTPGMASMGGMGTCSR